MDKKFWLVVGVITALFVGFLIFGGNKDANKSSGATAKPSNHVRGTGTKVTIVEYGDFQCPACSFYEPVMEQVMQKYSNEATMQFRHFPITSLHQNAFAAARAAEAAGKQDKFWEMYGKIYPTQDAWKNSSNANAIFESYAAEFGLDIAKYKADFKSPSVNDTINADMAAGQALGVDSTPTFIINGKIYPNPPAPTIEAFSAVIDKAIADGKKQ